MSLGNRRMLVLAPCLLLVLNYPWLAIFSQPTLVFGVPLLHLYLFVLWFVIILTVRLLVMDKNDAEGSGSPAKRSAHESEDAAK